LGLGKFDKKPLFGEEIFWALIDARVMHLFEIGAKLRFF
jgi:hypothetical protein